MPDSVFGNGGWLPPGDPRGLTRMVREAHRPDPVVLDVMVAAGNAASDDAHNGSMIALMPTEEDAQRLAIIGGEPAEELHCTLFYLGGDVTQWSAEQQGELISAVRNYVETADFGQAQVVDANIFGAAHWNGNSDAPSWVWSVGDAPDGNGLEQARCVVIAALESTHDQPRPDQHTPWVAHVCAEYSADPGLLPEMELRLGPVTFDRIRLSFGDDNTDIPLNRDVVTAAGAKPDPKNGVFRRRLTAAETASRFDFAGHQRAWETARNGVLHEWAGVTADWRNQINAQLITGSTDLHVDTTAGADVLHRRMLDAAQAAGVAQQRAAEQQGVTVPAWSVDDSVTAALGRSAFLRKVAEITARTLGEGLVASAERQAMRLLNTFSGVRLASEVDQFLANLTDNPAKDGIGTAMTAAQAAGQQAVLQAAPRATYYASEVLDDRVCDPCRDIDGQVFSSLEAAEAAYPGGCYEDCQGGGRCRGTIDAVWEDPGTTASASAEEATVTTAAEPCPTCPNDEHFAAGSAVTAAAEAFVWDGSESRFTDPQYQKAAAACDPGDGTVKERCFLPHHDPGGALNRDGLAAAAARVGTLKGHDAAAVSRARAHLRGHYNQLGDPVPDSLEAAAHTAALAIECPDGWKPDPEGDGCVPAIWNKGDTPPTCPPGMVRDPDGDGCVQASATAALAVEEPPGDVAAVDGQTVPWNGVLAVEGEETGDGREFAQDSLTWRDLPIPLRWNKEDSHGGEPHTVAVNVGRIDTIERVGNELRATGVFNLGEVDGQRAMDLVKGKFLRGVSIDADSIKDPDIELVYPESVGGDDDDPLAMLFGPPPEKVIYHGGRISAATLVDIPAFAQAYIALTDDTGAVVAGGALSDEEWQEVFQRAARGPARPEPQSLAPEQPPAEWFKDPKLSQITGITVTREGRVYGHAAEWGTCHIGQAGCVAPPREDYHAHFMTGELDCADGTTVSVGQITVGMGHAPMNANAAAAVEHYDDTSCAVADVVVGNDAHGIWVAGSLRPGCDPLKVRQLRGAGRVSGDWRRIGGKLRLVGLLAINVAGFALRTRARVASGAPMALVAAGLLDTVEAAPVYSEDQLDQMALRRVMNITARRVWKE
jgi:hypothetical protein